MQAQKVGVKFHMINKKPGPSRTGKGEQVVVRLHNPLLAALDEWCSTQLDTPTRAEALRRLAARSLASDSTAAAKPRRPAKK
jgi:hypothetical protein